MASIKAKVSGQVYQMIGTYPGWVGDTAQVYHTGVTKQQIEKVEAFIKRHVPEAKIEWYYDVD